MTKSSTRTQSYRAGQQVQWKSRPELVATLVKTNRPYKQWLVRTTSGKLQWWWESDMRYVKTDS